MATVHADLGVPFKSPDEYVIVVFDYDAGIVATIKSTLASLRLKHPAIRSQVGGWLPQLRAWFVHPGCWREVRRALVEAGHEVVGEVDYSKAEERIVEATEQRDAELLARIDAILDKPVRRELETAMNLMGNYRRQILDSGSSRLTRSFFELLRILENAIGSVGGKR